MSTEVVLTDGLDTFSFAYLVGGVHGAEFVVPGPSVDVSRLP